MKASESIEKALAMANHMVNISLNYKEPNIQTARNEATAIATHLDAALAELRDSEQVDPPKVVTPPLKGAIKPKAKDEHR